MSGVRVTYGDTVKVYEAGHGFDFDGYGDLIVSDLTGHKIATRRRGTWDEIELVTGPDLDPSA